MRGLRGCKSFGRRLLLALMLCLMFSINAMATTITVQDANLALQRAFIQGYAGATGLDSKAANQYKSEGGGYVTWSQLVDANAVQTGYVNETEFNKLTTNAKQAFLIDMVDISNAAVDSTYMNEAGVSTDTQNTWMTNLQSCSGVGSQLMTTLLQHTKPDFVSANRILAPFSGPFGIFLGVTAVLMMMAIVATMLLDLMYIGVPVFRMFCDGDGDGGGNGQGAKPKFISYEAVSAVRMAENDGGGNGQGGSTGKAALGIYLKKRVIMLCILGICLLYLVQGQIFTLVGWLLDLMSGFLGF